MRKTLFCLVAILSGVAHAIDSTHPYLNIGTIDKYQLIEEYRSSESLYTQYKTIIEQRIKNAQLIPDHIKFMRMEKTLIILTQPCYPSHQHQVWMFVMQEAIRQ